jgi:hypothetical protein
MAGLDPTVHVLSWDVMALDRRHCEERPRRTIQSLLPVQSRTYCFASLAMTIELGMTIFPHPQRPRQEFR